MDMWSINDVQDNMQANEGWARVSFIMIRVSYRGGNRKFIIIYHLKRTDPSTLAGNQSRHLLEWQSEWVKELYYQDSAGFVVLVVTSCCVGWWINFQSQALEQCQGYSLMLSFYLRVSQRDIQRFFRQTICICLGRGINCVFRVLNVSLQEYVTSLVVALCHFKTRRTVIEGNFQPLSDPCAAPLSKQESGPRGAMLT